MSNDNNNKNDRKVSGFVFNHNLPLFEKTHKYSFLLPLTLENVDEKSLRTLLLLLGRHILTAYLSAVQTAPRKRECLGVED